MNYFSFLGNAYKGKLLLSASREYLLNSEVCFKNSPCMWDVKEILLKVRAPIIKLYHRDLELNCDLSFTNGITVEKTGIIKCECNNYWQKLNIYSLWRHLTAANMIVWMFQAFCNITSALQKSDTIFKEVVKCLLLDPWARSNNIWNHVAGCFLFTTN